MGEVDQVSPATIAWQAPTLSPLHYHSNVSQNGAEIVTGRTNSSLVILASRYPSHHFSSNRQCSLVLSCLKLTSMT